MISMSSTNVCVYCEFFFVCVSVFVHIHTEEKHVTSLLAYTCMCVCIHTNVFMCIHTYTLIKSLELTFICFSIVVEGAGGEDKLAKFFAGMLTVNPFVFPIIYNIYKYLSEKNVENHKWISAYRSKNLPLGKLRHLLSRSSTMQWLLGDTLCCTWSSTNLNQWTYFTDWTNFISIWLNAGYVEM